MLNLGAPIELKVYLDKMNVRRCIDMPSKQNLKAIDAWQTENVERIVIKPNKKEHFSDRIQIAIDRGIAKSRQAYILDAVRKALDEDDIPMIED